MNKKCYAIILAFFVLIAALGLCTLIGGAIAYSNRPIIDDYVHGGGLMAQYERHIWYEEG